MVMAEKTGLDVGARMRRAREARGVNLRQIAAATKISVGALEALERNDISRLPGGIFSRAFVRSYASEVGLDPEQTVRDFIEQFPHDSVTAGSPHVPQEDHEAIESQRRSAATAATLIAISLPLVGAILYFTLIAPTPAAPPPQAPASVAVIETPPAAVEPLTVEITATATVTLAIDADGVAQEPRLVEPGERLVFAVAREISIGVSDAAAVQVTINGTTAMPLGAAGDSPTVRITRDNFESFLPSR